MTVTSFGERGRRFKSCQPAFNAGCSSAVERVKTQSLPVLGIQALVVELVDILVLETIAERRGSSNLP